MVSAWFVVYLVLAGFALLQAAIVAIQTWEHRRFARSCMGGLGEFTARGRAAVFAPCKGVDVGLEGNLRALLAQDYDDFEVTFLVESLDDPACTVIRRVMADYPSVATRLVVTGKALTSGQKVHNLRVGTSGLQAEVEYLAFIDSDARPRPEWLRTLVGRLSRHDPEVVTGYRWLVPTKGTLVNHLLYSMNCRVMALLGRSSHCLVWGGSWGIRRSVFDSIGLRDQWREAINDDLSVSRQLRRVGLSARFEPGCVVASPLDISARQMGSFLRRQYLFGRYYVADWWLLAVAATTLSAAGWLGSLIALGTCLALGSPLAWVPATVGGLLYLVSARCGRMRQDLVRTYFPEKEKALRSAGRFDIWFGPVTSIIHWLGVLSSAWGRTVDWRGIRYRVASDGTIRSVQHRIETIAAPSREHVTETPEPASHQKAA